MKRSFLKMGALFIAWLAVASCGEQKPAAPNPASLPVPVNLYGVVPERPVFYDKFPANVVAKMQVDIRPVVEGYVTGIFFNEGEHVKKGQKLYAIDDSKYQATYNQAQAQVRVAESNLELAQKDADRYNYLNQHDAVAKQVLDRALTSLQNSKNQVTTSKQDLAKAQTDLGYSIIKAPFDGTIGISQVRLGNAVTSGQTILNTISTNDPMTADFEINEKQITKFVQLQQLKPNPADSIFTLVMPDNTLYNQVGQLNVIDRGVNTQTGTVIVRVGFPNPAGILKAGMSCQVRVRNTDTSQQILIPGKAIVEQMGEYFVYVAKDTLLPNADTSNKKPQTSMPHALQRKVALGPTIGSRVIIKWGIRPGDSVVVDGVQKLHDGSVIKH